MLRVTKILSALFIYSLLLLLVGCPSPVPRPAPVPPPRAPVLPKPMPPTVVAPTRIFHWPPPQASSTYTIPLSAISKKPVTLADADNILSKALGRAGYEEKQYYQLPESKMPGFVLVTRIEAFDKDGSPKMPGRWPSSDLSMVKDDFSVGNILKVLLHMNEGHYRVIAFVFSGSPVEQDTSARLSATEAQKWLSSGYTSLPESIGSARFTSKQNFCTVLVYEFEKQSNKGAANLSLPGTVSAKRQVEKTGIFK